MILTYKHTKYAAYIGNITQAIVNNLMPLLFVSFSEQFSLSLDKISFLITMNFGVQIITDIISAKYTDKIGYRKMTVAAHVFAFIGMCTLSFLPFITDAFAGLCICSAIMAVGGGITEVIISPVVEALPGDEKASAMSLLHSFYCWGQVSVVLFSTLYFSLAGIENWRFLPLLWALVPLFNIFLFSKVPLRSLNENSEPMPLRELIRVRVFWIFIILMICSGASELAMSQWASYFAEEGLGVSKTMGDLLGPCAFAVLMGISRSIFGAIGDRINLKTAISASSLLCAVSYLVTVFSPYPILSLAGCSICGFSVGIMWPGTFSLSAKNYPAGGTAMFAILALSGDVGCSLGPNVAGLLGNLTGNLKDGLLAVSLFPVILLIGTLLIPENENHS